MYISTSFSLADWVAKTERVKCARVEKCGVAKNGVDALCGLFLNCAE